MLKEKRLKQQQQLKDELEKIREDSKKEDVVIAPLLEDSDLQLLASTRVK
jgi:hypothetical protein